MNLATRCTTCGTIFRVVQDQLRVSEGWVRCGRCAEVFDAREQLFDLERDSPPPWPPQGAAPVEPPPPPRRPVQEPPYHPYQGDFQPSRPSPIAPEPEPQMAPATAPQPAPPPYQPPYQPPAPRQSGARDSWLANDDDELNPFAPSRPLPEPDADEIFAGQGGYSRYNDHLEDESEALDDRAFAADPNDGYQRRFGESHLEDHEDRREPFLDAPAAAPVHDPRSDLPEPKGMRFEEDELPPPMTDDERPDVLLALSPATAAQLDSLEPAFGPDTRDPTPAPESRAERKAREAKEKAEAKDAAKEAARLAKEAAVLAKLEAKQAKREAIREAKQAKVAAETEARDSELAMPSFMRQGGVVTSRWDRPAMRIGLSAGATFLSLVLLAQGLWHGREAIAAQYPATRSGMEAFSRAFGQELKPWQHIEALSVESSSLNPAGGSGNQYKLSLALRNRSGWEVAQPWVDLSLTDAAGQLVSRRMFSPTEMQAGKPSLPSGADQQMQLVFDSGAQKISGYTVELFYP